jgi:hypothetical protein
MPIAAAVMVPVVVDRGAEHRLAEGPPLNLLAALTGRTRPLRNQAQNLAKTYRQREANLKRWVMTPRIYSQCNMQYQ